MVSPNPAVDSLPTGDELDDILNGTHEGRDIFDTSDIQAQATSQARPISAVENTSLGIDEEVKIVKKRQPIPKLDDQRLLSDAGIPKLRRISKERLRLKGKGHEYGDVARMLNMYQLWLDDLYPRAKFADGLAIIEKLGHSKRLQYMRKEWIDENKPTSTVEVDIEEKDIILSDAVNGEDGLPEQETRSAIETINNVPRSEGLDNIPTAEESGSGMAGGEDPDEDELDALLAESAAPEAPSKQPASQPSIPSADDDPFAAEMEAMEGMEDMW